MRVDPQPVRVIEESGADVLIAGVGGTGGYVLQQLARLVYGLTVSRGGMTHWTCPTITLIDGDTVEERNLLRQYFLPQDIHRNKAEVLAERYERAYGIPIKAIPEYITNETKLATRRRATYGTEPGTVPEGSIVVGCVDNAATRKILHEKLHDMTHVVYIDAGNSAVRPPEDPAHLDRYELAELKQQGWEGQVIAGVRIRDRTVIPFPGHVLPGLIDVDPDDTSDLVPSDPRCGEVVVSNPQRHMTNLMAASVVMAYLTTLLDDGTLLNHRTHFDARKMYVRSYGAQVSMMEVLA